MALANEQWPVLRAAIDAETDLEMLAFLNAGNLPGGGGDWYNELRY